MKHYRKTSHAPFHSVVFTTDNDPFFVLLRVPVIRIFLSEGYDLVACFDISGQTWMP
jgi:hypothetical protein